MKYHGVSRVSWDELWRALRYRTDGKEVWDRVTRKEAMKIDRAISAKQSKWKGN